ncbi:nuclear transport factor 2 family protein [Legionella gresilensis]|uniref:nuclear transport factor 2 family protein n=1 Tax=Legionella gresilensis TaxID=91823 RepID=UPI001041A6A6|nr:nuclear transport factor 2 family protein [Legionella gresilensis]
MDTQKYTPNKLSTSEKLFKNFCDSYKHRDLPHILSLFTENATLWGTGIDEYRYGLKEIEEQLLRAWSQSEDSEITIINFNPAPAHSFWASANCSAKLWIDGQTYILEHLRVTICIDEEDQTWKIAHLHASFPDFRNPRDSAFPITGS